MGIIKKIVTYQTICIISALLSGVALLVAVASPANGYEISIYSSTPLAVWTFLILSTILCGFLIMKEASQDKTNSRWLYAFGILIANGIIILLMSVLRNYYTIGGDTLMHIGYVEDLSNGIISAQNRYPMVHLIPTGLVMVGLSSSLATNLSPVFCYVIYVASFYGLARIIWTDNRKVIIATTLSAILLLPHGTGIAATLVGASMFPLTLLVLFKLRQDFKIKYIIAFLGFIIMVSLLHPLALEVAFIALIVACFVFAGNRWKLTALTILLLPMAIWWYGYWWNTDVPFVLIKDVTASIVPSNTLPATDVMLPTPSKVLPQVIGETNGWTSVLPSMVGIQATETIGESNGLSLILRRYGSEILLGCLAILSLIIIAKKYIRRTDRNVWYVNFGSLFLILNLMWLVGWYLQLDVYNSALSRMINWVPTVSIVLVTPLLVKLLGSRKMRMLSLMAVAIVLVIISGYAIFNLYPSPITGVENKQVTHQEVKGIAWLIEKGEPSTPIVHLNSQRVSRYVAALYGVEWCRNNQIYYWLHELNYKKGFSYNNHLSIAEEYSEDVYLVVTKLDRMLPRWTKEKLYYLESDIAATLIYKDGDEFQVWYVESYVKSKRDK